LTISYEIQLDVLALLLVLFIKTIAKIDDLNVNTKDTRSRLQVRAKPQRGKPRNNLFL